MEIRGENYRITYDPSTTTVVLEGIVRLYGATGYFSIDDFSKNRQYDASWQPQESLEGCVSLMQLFEYLVNQQSAVITVNLQKLELFNSSGINTLSKFIIKVRNKHVSQVIMKGTEQFFWQGKILGNLKKLMPTLIVELE